MNREIAKKVADAVLYEGYMLYPYRPSAIKNRQRWTFGILYPPTYGEVGRGTERCGMHSECLLEAANDATVYIQLRFLHLLARQVGKSLEGRTEDNRFEAVPSLVVDDHRVESWDEAVERSVEFKLSSLAGPRQQVQFCFPGSSSTEALRDHAGRMAGLIRHTQQEVAGTVSVISEKIDDSVFKLTIDITNDAAITSDAADKVVADRIANPTLLAHDPNDRNSALLRSLLSAHTILAVSGGNFVSLLEPPEALREAVSECRNIGNFPVLVGVPPEREMLLCSPIVLYDYPQIAPESASNFYDATEMDEMLTLRVLTLTDEEKNEMRRADDHVCSLLERTEQGAREQLMRTHGTIRSLRPVSEKP